MNNNKIRRLTVDSYSDSQTLYIDASSEIIAKILAYIAELNVINNDSVINSQAEKIKSILTKNNN